MEQLEFDFHKYADKKIEIFMELADCVNNIDFFIEYPNVHFNVAANQITIYNNEQKVTFTIDIKIEEPHGTI